MRYLHLILIVLVPFGAVITALPLLAQELSPVANSKAVPIERAQGATLSKAVGHYARSRSLLIAAIREFDNATNLVDPDSLIDAEHFRTVLLERSRDLEHILSPQPRVSKEGVRFEPDSRLLGEAPR